MRDNRTIYCSISRAENLKLELTGSGILGICIIKEAELIKLNFIFFVSIPEL